MAVDYLNGDNYEYSYMLEGYSDEWVELQKNNRVAFMNIPAGSYLLHVRYKSNVMDRATQVYTLPLTVLPPWYRTTAALVCYILLAAGLVWAVCRLAAQALPQAATACRSPAGGGTAREAL